MRLSLSARWTLKDKSPEYHGRNSEFVSYAKDKPWSFESMAYAIIVDMLCYYIRFADAKTLNASLEKLRTKINSLTIWEEWVEPKTTMEAHGQLPVEPQLAGR